MFSMVTVHRMVILRAVVLPLLFLCHLHNRTCASYLNVCPNNVTTWSCPGGQRIIISHLVDWRHNSVTRHLLNLIEQCSGQYRCRVAHLPEECIEGIAGCAGEQPILEIKKSRTVRLVTNSSNNGFFLMSENYLKGQYMNSENIQCHIRYLEKSNYKYQDKQIYLESYEFAPFTKTKRFCLRIKNLAEPVICSGSWNLYAPLGYYSTHSEDGSFRLTLDNKSSLFPQLRFWLYVRVPKEGAIQAECKSQTEVKGQDTLSGTRNIGITAAVGILSAIIVVIAAIGVVYKMTKFTFLKSIRQKHRRHRLLPSSPILEETTLTNTVRSDDIDPYDITIGNNSIASSSQQHPILRWTQCGMYQPFTNEIDNATTTEQHPNIQWIRCEEYQGCPYETITNVSLHHQDIAPYDTTEGNNSFASDSEQHAIIPETRL